MSEQKKPIGALWTKTGKKGDFFSGNIEVNGQTVKITVFKNDYKKEAKHPDYKIFVDNYVRGTDDRTNPLINAARGRDANGINNDEIESDLPF